MTVLIAVVHVWPTVVVKIFACTFHPILKATALDFAALFPAHIRSATVRLARLLFWPEHLPFSLTNRLLRSARQVRHTLIVATAKAITIRFSLVARNPRIAVLIAVVHIWPPVIVEILARAFDPVLETLALDLLQFLRRRIPAAAILGRG
jgi:hypothetical protein